MRPQNLSYHVDVYAAVERIVLRAGCGAATVRAVATEGDLSPSTVRYYFRNQSHLLACAFSAVDDHFRHELGSHPFALGRFGRGEPPGMEDAVVVLAVHVPTRGVALERLRLLHAYRAWARHDPAMAVTVGGFDQRLLDLCRRVLLGLGLAPARAPRQARILRALLTGLADEVVTVAEPEGEYRFVPPDRLTDRGVRAILTRHLTAVRALAGVVERPAGPPVDRAG
ncbi:hypothetical protein [Nocardioides sp. Soil805]|uniref:hypothetical protein n=1 Tax=Nocardioides sp. Soil805 TaxID=1736416 RepID=UPI0007037E13|nr:hypothetical protein [Nocardioides sp. Soil805]KRF37529.1 hypothetical protein ASG94_09530 [Nocardioides sp. Soil805]